MTEFLRNEKDVSIPRYQGTFLNHKINSPWEGKHCKKCALNFIIITFSFISEIYKVF